MESDRKIKLGAKAIADDLCLPGGARKMPSRVVADHLEWFDAAEARCVYRKLKLGRSGGEVRQGWRVI
jgi:hypothetical protein